jgi:hypothetical protein
MVYHPTGPMHRFLWSALEMLALIFDQKTPKCDAQHNTLDYRKKIFKSLSFFFMVLGFELRASLTLWATSLVLFACCFSEKVVHFWPG